VSTRSLKLEENKGWRPLRAGCLATASSRKVHTEKLHNLHSSLKRKNTNSTTVTWAGHLSHMRDIRTAHTILVGNPERKIRRISRRRWENNIKKDTTYLRWVWTKLLYLKMWGQWRVLANTEINLNVS
jgi:hypothetical protein